MTDDPTYQVQAARIVQCGSGRADDGTPITVLVIDSSSGRQTIGIPTADFGGVMAAICRADEPAMRPKDAPKVIAPSLMLPNGRGRRH